MLHPNICGTATCKNTLGKYECECAEGYMYNSTSKNCEGRSFPTPPFSFSFIFPFFFFIPLLYQTPTCPLVVYLLQYDPTVCSFRGSIRLYCMLYIQLQLLTPRRLRVLQYIPVSCCMPDNFHSLWKLSCPTVESTFCPSSQIS